MTARRISGVLAGATLTLAFVVPSSALPDTPLRTSLGGGTAVPAAAAPADVQEAERYTLAGERAAIYNLVGEVRVQGGDAAGVTVEVVRGGPDRDRLDVATGAIGGRETLRVRFPGDHVRYPGFRGRTELEVEEDGTFGDDDSDGGRRVTIGDRGDLEAHADLTVTVPDGRSVEIYLGVGRVSASNVRGELSVDVSAAPIAVRGHRGPLRLDTGSGSVEVSDADGELSVDTGSGAVTLSSIRGARLSVDTGSGRVRGSDLDAPEVDVDTGSGGIDLTGVTARRVHLDTGSGSIRISLLSDIDALELDTGSGDVAVTVPSEFGSRLEIETGSGDIDLGFPLEVTRMDDDAVYGTLGDGAGRTTIDTGSGDVRIDRG